MPDGLAATRSPACTGAPITDAISEGVSRPHGSDVGRQANAHERARVLPLGEMKERPRRRTLHTHGGSLSSGWPAVQLVRRRGADAHRALRRVGRDRRLRVDELVSTGPDEAVLVIGDPKESVI
jgi:hypothetical protein